MIDDKVGDDMKNTATKQLNIIIITILLRFIEPEDDQTKPHDITIITTENTLTFIVDNEPDYLHNIFIFTYYLYNLHNNIFTYYISVINITLFLLVILQLNVNEQRKKRNVDLKRKRKRKKWRKKRRRFYF